MKSNSSIQLIPLLRRLGLFSAALLCCAIMSGCVVGRRTVELPITVIAPSGAPTKGTIAVGAVADARAFENKPASPSTPSIDGDALALSAAERATFIGRQRNGFGKAMGDIALPANDSVILRTRALLEEGFKRRGYAVAQTAGANGNSVDVKIEEFWAWFTPGAFSITFEGRITCTLTFTKGGATKSLTVRGYGKNSGQVASDANWALAYTRTYDDFITNLNNEMEKNGL